MLKSKLNFFSQKIACLNKVFGFIYEFQIWIEQVLKKLLLAELHLPKDLKIAITLGTWKQKIKQMYPFKFNTLWYFYCELLHFRIFHIFITPLFTKISDAKCLPNVFVYVSLTRLPVFENQYPICLKYKPSFNFRCSFSF